MSTFSAVLWIELKSRVTVDLEWLVYFGMYFKDFTAMLENDRENDRDESHQIFLWIRQSLQLWCLFSNQVKISPTGTSQLLREEDTYDSLVL